MKATIDYRRRLVAEVCIACDYYGECLSDRDCQALKILVKINEDMDCGNPDY